MSGIFKLFGASVVSMGVCMVVCAANAAQPSGRAAYSNVRSSSIGATGAGATSARMPTMPTLPIISVGNVSQNVPTNPTVPDAPSTPDVPDEPDNPDIPDEPVVPECPDGGVKDSKYTVAMCMNDLLRCINNGALPNGLNDMFNEDLRNSIVNGMGLCANQVDKCISSVRRDCANVYRAPADVWIDFNSRKVQPEYYSFVLRKTGLTPNQAENTCRLLDKNTYGSSFAAVANSGLTTAEYNNQVGAYNKQGGNILIKAQPQGPQVNDNNPGVDGQRGHYARWDATTATCYLRVAAYNKDKHISNKWLFGVAGDDRPAEVWKAAGDTFSCNKDLFGFSLMKDTSTVAVVGVAGGTLVGAGVGAIAGHGKRAFDCANDKHREMLMAEFSDARTVSIVNEYLVNDITVGARSVPMESCSEIVKLYDRYNQLKTAIAECEGAELEATEYFEAFLSCPDNSQIEQCIADAAQSEPMFQECLGKGFSSAQQCVQYLYDLYAVGEIQVENPEIEGQCVFKSLNLERQGADSKTYCMWGTQKCIESADVVQELKRLDLAFDEDVLKLMRDGEKSNMAKSIAIGAGVGAGAGGLATAITALVERGNINCRVGDGLAQVGLNKSHSIGSLKDFYVKWNLQLPDTIAPTATVNDCQSWKSMCGMITDYEHCKNAQFNYKTPDGQTELVRTACKVSGSACVENYPVAKSYGACK